MNDVATFFRDRHKDPGETYQLTFEGWKGTHRVSVYSQRPIESRALENQNIATQQDYDVALKDLRNAVTGSGGGGMIVIANDEGRSRIFSVVRVNAKSYAAAQGFVTLSPGRPSAFVSIDGNNRGHKCAVGAYALVPVSEEAQQRLQDFIGYLSWLSPDLESVMLNAIRRPSLDHRLDRVETRLFAQTADEALASSQQGVIGRVKGWMARSVPPPVVRLATAMLLILLVAMNGAALYYLYSRSDTNVLSRISRAILRPKEPDVEPVVRDARMLLEALHKSKDPLLRRVDDRHFQSLPEPWVNEEIQKAIHDSRPVLWGLVKLQLLAIDPTPQNSEFLDDSDAVRLTKTAYGAIPPGQIPDDARQFLAAAGCRMHYAPPLPFDTSDCTKVPADAFEKGLQRLTTFVKGRR
jgi:hypothetical protein